MRLRLDLVKVGFRGANRRMTKPSLHRAQIGTPEQLRGVRTAQRVDGDG